MFGRPGVLWGIYFVTVEVADGSFAGHIGARGDGGNDPGTMVQRSIVIEVWIDANFSG
jgi:hypothetical protein